MTLINNYSHTPVGMASHHQSRSSASSSSSTGSAYRMILDHVMSYPGSYDLPLQTELPLRTMYNLNCAARVGPILAASSSSHSSSNSSSPEFAQGEFKDSSRVPSFSEGFVAQIRAAAAAPPRSLPASYIVGFVQRCFPEDLRSVSFPEALIGLDYLKDLETRRRREVQAAMERMGIDRDVLLQDAATLPAEHAGARLWLQSIEERTNVVDALYTQLYVGLRRWVLINELNLPPFNKHNCVAMLNTLYPPTMTTQPTSRLTRRVLKEQRDAYFRYITSVERFGTGVLRNLMLQGKAPDDENAWPSVVRIMQHYLQVATSMINECREINSIEDLCPVSPPARSPPPIPETAATSKESRRKGKADSGISFTSTSAGGMRQRSTSTRSSVHSGDDELPRPKTPSAAASRSSNSALEKLARGLMSIGRGKTEVATEIQDGYDEPEILPERPVRMLRKMRSLGSFDGRLRQASESTPTFDAVAMKAQRERFEAAAKMGKEGKRLSNEV